MTAARLPPAEEPPVASLDKSRLRMSFPLLRTQRTASQASCTAAGKGFSGASLHNSQFHDRYQVGVVCLPIIYCYHNTFPSCAEVRGVDVLRVDSTEDPAAVLVFV